MTRLHQDYPDLAKLAASREFDAKAAEWERLRAAFEDGAHCRGCQFSYRWTEGHGERLRGCRVIDKDYPMIAANECPALGEQQ